MGRGIFQYVLDTTLEDQGAEGGVKYGLALYLEGLMAIKKAIEKVNIINVDVDLLDIQQFIQLELLLNNRMGKIVKSKEEGTEALQEIVDIIIKEYA
jgi:hypothetical protein